MKGLSILNPNKMALYKSLFVSSLVALLFSSGYTFIDRETTIVVVDGKALLVDIDEKGEILETYMEVDDYFENSADHSSKVIEAKKIYHRLTKEQMDQIRFISMADEGWDLDEFMVANLVDLASHYQQTYANQIEITIPKNRSNTHLIDENLKMIKDILTIHGVNQNDIMVHFKIDLGDEPTRFVKVVSNFKRLEEFSSASE